MADSLRSPLIAIQIIRMTRCVGDSNGNETNNDSDGFFLLVFPSSLATARHNQLPLCRCLPPQCLRVHGDHHHHPHHHHHHHHHRQHRHHHLHDNLTQVGELQMDTSYTFAVMAFNKLGESGYSVEVQGNTASKTYLVANDDVIDAKLLY